MAPATDRGVVRGSRLETAGAAKAPEARPEANDHTLSRERHGGHVGPGDVANILLNAVVARTRPPGRSGVCVTSLSWTQLPNASTYGLFRGSLSAHPFLPLFEPSTSSMLRGQGAGWGQFKRGGFQ
jgi:hypothetical protein